MSNADDLTAVFQQAAGIFAENFYADNYRVVELTSTRDTRGGSTVIETTIDTGRCSLNVSGQVGQERLSTDRVAGVYPYTADFPLDAVIEPTHIVYINERKFRVVSVFRGGNWATSITVDLEEWM